MTSIAKTTFFVTACALTSAVAFAAPGALPLDKIRLPPGFVIELVARVDNAREMTLGTNGTLFVGSMGAGKISAVSFPPGAPPRVTTVASGLTLPLGVAFRDGALYASSVNRILRFDNIEQRLANPPAPVVVSDKFPSETHHGGKFIAFGPDGKLYVPVGAPCNICEPDPDRYANLMRMNADGSGLEVFARGIRDSVGFDWDPQTNELWFTDNGRDSLGDDVPPDELNHAPRAGLNFGYPYCHAGTIPIPNSARVTIAGPSSRRRRRLGRTWRRWACVSTPGPRFLLRIAIRCSSRNTVHGTAVPRSGTAFRWYAWITEKPSRMNLSQRDGCRDNHPGDARPTCW